MKKFVFCLFMAALFVQCTQDQELDDHDTTQNLAYQLDLNLSKETPNIILDPTERGLYVGTLTTKDLSFHERIYINIENDGSLNAQIITNNEKHFLIGEKLVTKKNHYFFKGKIGQFYISIENNKALITNASFNNMEAEVNVFKSTSQNRMTPTLGTFATTQGGAATGTWDIMFTTTNADRFDGTVVSIVKFDGNGNNMSSHTLENANLLRYNRRCDDIPAGETTRRVQLQLHCKSDNSQGVSVVTFGGQEINFTYRLLKRVFIANCDYPTTSELTALSNEWSWAGFSGTIDMDITTLPAFAE